MRYGYPEDWILTMGPRIKRIHFKDFKLGGRGEPAHFADLLKGDVNLESRYGRPRQSPLPRFVSGNWPQSEPARSVESGLGGVGQDPGFGLSTDRFIVARNSESPKLGLAPA
jgi:hypothetical protein